MSKPMPDENNTMLPVSTIVKLSGKYIGGTSGKDYADSVRLAQEWASRRDNDKKYPYYTILVDYYPQIMGKKSILFSFNLIPKETDKSLE